MAIGAARRQIERLWSSGSVAGLSEGQLLDRFVSGRDDAAFEALVARHGPMVHAVCRRMLRDPNDADDAFQATFLVLVRRAGSLRRRDLLGNWLYGVAVRVASRARTVTSRRLARETPGGPVVESASSSAEDPPCPEPVLHEELQRLPEKYRMPVVLCYLEGLTHEEAADRLRWPLGTVKGRLARAREQLRSRLTRRGVALAAAGVALDQLGQDARAALPERLVAPTVQAAAHAVARTSLAGLVSAQVVALSEGVTRAMSLTPLKLFSISLAVAGAMVGSAYAFQFGGGSPASKSAGTQAEAGKSRGTPEANPPAAGKGDAGREVAKVAGKSEAPTEGPPSGWNGDSLFDQLLGRHPIDSPEQLFRLMRLSQSIAMLEGNFADTADWRQQVFHHQLNRMKRLESLLNRPGVSPNLQGIARSAVGKAESELADVTKASPPGGLPGTMGGPGMGGQPGMMGGGPGGVASPGMPGAPSGAGMAGPVPGMGGGVSTGGMGGMGGGSLGQPGFTGGGGEDTDPVDRLRVIIASVGPQVAAKDKSPRTQAILTKLEEPISMNFANETPLEEVIKYIKSVTAGPNDQGIAVYVDPQGLQEAEKTTTSPVQIDLEGVPLKTTLRLILKQLGLAYCVKDGLLFISTPTSIRQELLESLGDEAPEALKLPSGAVPMQGGGMGGGFR